MKANIKNLENAMEIYSKAHNKEEFKDEVDLSMLSFSLPYGSIVNGEFNY